MKDRIVLKKLFSAAEQSNNPVWDCSVLALTAQTDENTLSITLGTQQPLEETALQLAKESICRHYQLSDINFEVQQEASAPDEAALARLQEAFTKKYPSVAGALRHAVFTLDGQTIHIGVQESWHLLRIEQLLPQMENQARELLQQRVKITAGVAEAVQDKQTSYEEQRQQELNKLSQEFAASQPAPSASKAKTKEGDGGPRRSFVRKKDPNAPQFRVQGNEDAVIYGKAMNREITRMAEITLDSGRVTVQGDIFFRDSRKLNGKGKTVLTFDFSDGTGSMRVVKVLPDEEAADLAGKLKDASNVIVQGMVNYSTFDKDINLSPTAIIKGSKKKKKDDAPKKRVELHLHTTMSSMDGICDVGKALGMAADLGHTAMAVTDHGVAQAFPDAMNAAKKLKGKGKEIKVLYGIEAYCVNDLSRKKIVKGYCETPVDGEIIVFDLETTGLNPTSCEIIEIAAVLVEKGEIKQEYHKYVKPNTLIPAKITDLTGISDQTVQNAPSIEEVLPEFLEFCGKRPLCAHNAEFDVSFLRQACANLGIQREFCYIDTVELSRVLMPQLSKHKLNTIADAMGFRFKHHRAEDDTNVLARIFFNLIQMLKGHGHITHVKEINDLCDEIRSGESEVKSKKSHHLLILVKNREGLMALYKMISEAHLRYYKRHPIIPMSILAQNREHLILGSACEAGELFGAIVAGKSWNELVSIAEFYDFLEIQPIGNNRFMLQQGIAKDEEQLRSFNRMVLKLGDALKKPVCATGDVHFLQPEDALYREILMTGMGFSDAGNQAPLYYRTTQEMLDEFAYLGKERAYEVVVENTNLIADQCEVIMPVLDGTYPPSIENSARDIEEMSRRKAEELYGRDGVLPEFVSQRLEAELTPIIKHGFDVMYIIAQKLVSKSVSDGYLVGSRGSVGSSFVAYLTGITEVNSLAPHYRCPKCKYSELCTDITYQTGVDMPDKDCPECGTKLVKDGFNIPFATFLGFDGDKAPDIDLNFSGEYQLKAHKETIKLFGEGNVYKAGTIGTVKERTAYGFVKKYLEEKGRAVNKAEENRLVLGCTGIKRTTGQHPGGLIVVPQGRSIYEFCPVQHPADDTESDVITTHFDYHSIHDNLLKLDLLGHDDPTMIRKLHDLSGMDPRTVPLDDKETMRIFTDIGALGIETDDILEQTGAAAIPEFGTKFVRGMLVETQPTTFDGLVRISGLSHGTNVWLNNAQDVIRAGLASLKDIICVRDDITTHLIDMGIVPKQAFTISESVRKGKGLKPEWEELLREHNLPEWYIDSCKKIAYMFPRAHAVAYVMMAYRIAWFKVHRPLEFYSAYFSIRANGFDAALMTKGDDIVCRKYRELKAMPKRSAIEDDMMITLEICHEFYKRGFSFAPLDVYRSEVNGFRIDGNTLIPPFTSLPGLGESAAQSIVDARKDGPFMSVEDLTLRCSRVSKSVAEALENIGALHGIPKSNQLDLFEMF